MLRGLQDGAVVAFGATAIQGLEEGAHLAAATQLAHSRGRVAERAGHPAQHHLEPRLPYYRLQLAPDSPRLPAGYVMLMFLALVPSIWRRAMEPALTRWFEQPAEPMSAGRRLTCFGLPAH